jgi:hypothetical protein
MSVQIPKTIFLFGHRQGHGKDTCCDILEKQLQKEDICYTRTSFAKKLKQHAAERYGLDASKMDSQEYKDWCPPHVRPKKVNFKWDEVEVCGHFAIVNGKNCLILASKRNDYITVQVPRTVRDILIEEGCKGREIWMDTWAWAAFSEIFSSGAEVGFISDFRFPNEFDSTESLFDLYCERNNLSVKTEDRPQFIKVQVYRENGIFKNDGADAEIPDDFGYWHYNIVNKDVENWYNNLEEEVSNVFHKFHRRTACLGTSLE